MKKLLLMISVLLVLIQTHAQAPQKMSFQAVIRKINNGLVMMQPVSMRISVIQGSANGTIVYQETHSPTTNSNGLVSLEIGTGTIVSGVFSNINWGNGPYFIKTETDPLCGTNYTVVGVSEFLSVPYALYALNSNNSGYLGSSKTLLNLGTLKPGINFLMTVSSGLAYTPLNNIIITNGMDNHFHAIVLEYDPITGLMLLNPIEITGAGTFNKWTVNLDGSRGANGLEGQQGQQGLNGLNGAMGPQGNTGSQGLIGLNGLSGTKGLQGLQGLNGSVGATGLNGVIGATGPIGPQGSIGNTGPQEIIGLTGSTGLQGIQGVDGLAGGATGAIGATGATGADGATGAKGDAGAAGTNGLNGANGVIGATGADGATGAKGDTGAAGTNGLNGTNGINGANGVNGATGTDGATGAKGDTGAAGTNGSNGTNGINGANGANGATCADGATGAKGDTGAAGTNGLNGTNGSNASILMTSIALSSTANGATINAGSLSLTPADGTNGGIVTIGTQTFGGAKTFAVAPILSTATASQALFTDASNNIVSNAITGSGNVVMSRDPIFSGTPTAPTAVVGNTTTQLATTAFVMQNNMPTQFSITSGTEISTTSTTDVVAGDMNWTPGAGKYFVTFNSQYSLSSSATLTNSVTDLNLVYTNLMAKPNTTSHIVTFANEVLTPGVYYTGAASTAAGTITLDAQSNPNAEFVFKFGGAFSTNSPTTINLINGASACNVYWIAAGAIALGANTSMIGTMIAAPGQITVATGCTIVGRLYSIAGAIGFDGTTLSLPTGCTSATNYGTVNNFAAFTSTGSITNINSSVITGDIGTDVGSITGFSTAIINGNYITPTNPIVSTNANFSIYQNNILIPYSTRTRISRLNLAEISLTAIATVGASQPIDIRWRIDDGTVKFQNRILTLITVK